MKDVKPILASLGLQDSEIATYLTALSKGPSSVTDLAHASGYSRQAVYTAIESLKERGLMLIKGSGKKSTYAAEHPDRLLTYARRRQNELKEHVEDLARIVPELDLESGGEKPMVRVSEGKDAIRGLLTELQTQRPRELSELTDMESMRGVFTHEELKPFRDALRKAKTKGKGIYVGEPISTSEPNSERYYLPKEYGGFKANIGIYGNVLTFVTFSGKKYCIAIENEEITKAFKLLFRLAHERAAELAPKK